MITDLKTNAKVGNTKAVQLVKGLKTVTINIVENGSVTKTIQLSSVEFTEFAKDVQEIDHTNK